MKTCTKCKQQKEETEFYSRGKESRTNSFCKNCFNQYCMERWVNRKLRVIEQFGNCCNDCKASYHYAVYEFHHLSPENKEYNWSKMRLFSEEKMQKELAKCVMLCANCHRLRHTLSD